MYGKLVDFDEEIPSLSPVQFPLKEKESLPLNAVGVESSHLCPILQVAGHPQLLLKLIVVLGAQGMQD